MNNVIYLDVLLLLNLFVNYFLFLGTAFLLHQKTKRWRLILGSAVGSLFSLLILFDSISYLLTVLIKLPLAALLVWIAFEFRSKALYIKLVLTFFLVNFLFGGVVLLIWLLFSPSGMYVNNGVVYFQISALTLVFGTLVAYLAIRVVGYLFHHKVQKNEIRQFVIAVDGKETVLTGLVDTGNMLSDKTSGLPVIVCEFSSVEQMIPPDIRDCFRAGGMGEINRLALHNWSSRLRVVPYATIGQEGILTAFRPDHFYLLSADGKLEAEKKVLIGVTDRVLSHGEYQAVLSTACL